LAVQKRHPDHWEAEIGGGAQGVSGKDAETATTSGHRRVKTDLYGKVRDQAGSHFSWQHRGSGTPQLSWRSLPFLCFGGALAKLLGLLFPLQEFFSHTETALWAPSTASAGMKKV
jgi:hypothetical protein